MLIQEIVFMQGDDANEALGILNEIGCEALFKHLLQWDNNDSPTEHINDLYEKVGTSDSIRYFDDYILTYNSKYGYCGLIKKIA